MEFTKNKIIEIAKDVIEVESNALKTLSENLPSCFEKFINSVYKYHLPLSFLSLHGLPLQRE